MSSFKLIDQIGLMGFSMGAYVATGVVMSHELNSRPSFVAAIYGGETGGRSIPSDAPPLFAAVAEDDAMMAGPVVRLYSEWRLQTCPRSYMSSKEVVTDLEPLSRDYRLTAGWISLQIG